MCRIANSRYSVQLNVGYANISTGFARQDASGPEQYAPCISNDTCSRLPSRRAGFCCPQVRSRGSFFFLSPIYRLGGITYDRRYIVINILSYTTRPLVPFGTTVHPVHQGTTCLWRSLCPSTPRDLPPRPSPPPLDVQIYIF